MLVSSISCLLVHLLVDSLHKSNHLLGQVIPFCLEFGARMADDNLDFLRGHVLRANLKPHRDAFLLSLGKLVAWVVRVSIVYAYAQSSATELSSDLMCLSIEQVCVILLLTDWDDDELGLGYLRRQDESFIIRVDHDHGSN